MTTTNNYIMEAFAAFVQAVRDGYGHRGEQALRAALQGDLTAAHELNDEHDELMQRIHDVLIVRALPNQRMMAGDTGTNLVAVLTPEMIHVACLLEGGEPTERGRAFLAQFS